MRTSRVHAVTSSVFRNSRQYLQTNERIFRLIEEREENKQRSGQHHSKNKKQENAPLKQNTSKKLIRRNGEGIVVKGFQSNTNSVVGLHNSLLKKTARLNHVIKKSRLNTYRSSI